MHATKTLPDDYQPDKTLDLSNPRTMTLLNLAALPLIFVFGWILARIIILLNTVDPFPGGFWGIVTSYSFVDWIGLPISIIIMLVFHELVHGAFFWLFTRQRPRFALRSGYAFAAAPEWYLPRSQYIWVGLSPLVVITLLCLLLSAFLPQHLDSYMLIIAAFNAAGALGDMIVVAWVWRQSSHVLVRDQGDKFSIYRPVSV